MPIFLAISSIAILLLCYYAYIQYKLTFSSHSGAVFKPTSPAQIQTMFDLIKLKPGDVVLDLGSGDGRILIEAANRGAQAIGYELDPILYFTSLVKIYLAGVSSRVKVYRRSLYDADFNAASVIVLYSFPKYLPKLLNVLENNLNRQVKVFSVDYTLSGMEPLLKKNSIMVYQFGLKDQLSNTKGR